MTPSSSPWIRDVTANSFEADVVVPSRERPVLLDFWSPSCGPCRVLGPLLEKLVEERKGQVHLAKINTDQEQELASYFGISAIPAVKVIINGQLVHEFEGLRPESELRRFLDDICPARNPEMEQAKAAERTSPARAEKLYRQVIEKEGDDHDAARLGLARMLLAQDRLDEIDPVLEPVAATGEVGEEADRIKAQVYLKRAAALLPAEAELRKRVAAEPKNAQALLDLGIVLAQQGKCPEALQALLSAAELDMKLAAGRVREVMVKVFYALGTNHPLANDYRSKLSRLLY
jgi:putative thioredoxin